MNRLSTAGLIATISGAVLVIALLLDWWDYPELFDRPEELPAAAAFSAEAVARSGQELEADAFAFFEFRDLVWLAGGVATFAFGLLLLVTRRAPKAIAMTVTALAFAAALLIALAVISPPDFGELPPPDPRIVDLGIDLPLDPEPSVVLALAAAVGCLVGAGLTLTGRTAQEE